MDAENQIEDFELSDVGGMDLSNFDIEGLDFIDEDDRLSKSRYLQPRVYASTKAMTVKYDNAVQLAKDLRIDVGQRAYALISGNFIFGDFIEAFLTEHNAKATKMTITTLSMSQDNIDSLHNLMKAGYIEELHLIISVYFWGNERNGLVPYIYRQLDIDNRFQLSVASIHTKTVHFKTLGGKHVVIHGSANLRSSNNIEQFEIEENKDLYDFYDEYSNIIEEKYKTINKPVLQKRLWAELKKKRFID